MAPEVRRSKRLLAKYLEAQVRKKHKKRARIVYEAAADLLQESPVFPLVCCNLWVLEICHFLNAEDLVMLGLVNKYFHLHFLGESSAGIWQERCAKLWQGKIYVPRELRADPSVTSYFISIRDASRRHFKSREELCSIDFHFKFKHDAGEYWTSHDPSYHGDVPMYRRFQVNGTLSRLPESSRVNQWAVGSQVDILDLPEIISTLPKIRWRFTTYKNGNKAQYIKINNWPSLEIRRLANWGWHLENIWTKYQSCSKETVANRF